MDINRKNIETLFKGFDASFKDAFTLAPDSWKKFAMTVQSGTASNIYPFIEQFGGMREWTGDRQIKNISSMKLEIINRSFEDTVAVKRNDIEDDQVGIYSVLISQMGLNAAKIWQELAVSALLSDAAVWADGAAFFGTSRKYGEHAVSNLSEAALSQDSYKAARQAMMEYKSHSGKALGVVPNLLIVGSKNEAAAFGIVKDSLAVAGVSGRAGSTENPWFGTADYIVLPELSGDYEDLWFLAASSGVLKPLVVQQRKQPVLTRLDSDNDENVFMRNEYIYGTEARGEAFLAFPHLIYKGGSAA